MKNRRKSFSFLIKRSRIKYLLIIIVTVFVLDFFGVFTHYFEVDFNKEFSYPIEGDVIKYAKQIRYNHKPDVEPINIYNYTYISNPQHKCKFEQRQMTPKLTLLIKSSLGNSDRRNAIRKSWGFEKRFSDVIIRRVFLLGIPKESNPVLEKEIEEESLEHKDIVQLNFHDTYFNNTIKTIMGFKWAVENCPNSKFYMFVDDDFYVSTKNILRFIRNPLHYPEYLEDADETIRKLSRKLSDSHKEAHDMMRDNEIKKLLYDDSANTIYNKHHIDKIRKFVLNNHGKQSSSVTPPQQQSEDEVPKNNYLKRKRRSTYDKELPDDVKLFAGFVFNSSPHRHKTSKWYVSLEEYPYHMWPTYVTAGAYILSKEALFDLYYTSMYTKHFRYNIKRFIRCFPLQINRTYFYFFRFDDIYLGLVAMKASIEVLHTEEIYFHKALYSGSQSYKYVIASHGYGDPKEMTQIWSEAKAAGHA